LLPLSIAKADFKVDNRRMREDYLTGEKEHMTPAERDIDKALRPLSFSDFTGQSQTRHHHVSAHQVTLKNASLSKSVTPHHNILNAS